MAFLIAEKLLPFFADDARTPIETPTVDDDQDDAIDSFADAIERTARERHDGALGSGSLAVAQVLASMSAGLSQVELAVRAAQ